MKYDYENDMNNVVSFIFEKTKGFPKVIKIEGNIKNQQINISKLEIPNNHIYYGVDPTIFDEGNHTILGLNNGNS